jgi:hypothetical protein
MFKLDDIVDVNGDYESWNKQKLIDNIGLYFSDDYLYDKSDKCFNFVDGKGVVWLLMKLKSYKLIIMTSSTHIMLHDTLLYKDHDDPNCNQLLWITRYLHHIGFDVKPNFIVERCFPQDVNTLPTLVINGDKIEGLLNIIEYYEKQFNSSNLLNNTNDFKSKYPNYTIKDDRLYH